MTDDPLLTVRQVAERLQVQPVSVQRWLRAGRMRGTLLSDRMGWRVPASEVEQMLASGKPAPPAEASPAEQ
ncbi:MAG: helix-turn-helix domain-containing protein [Dehalococcoidia bacterium]